MQWLQENWFWLFVGILFVSMHMGHGGHREQMHSKIHDTNNADPNGSGGSDA